ncbi:hypothetical protein Mal15_44460 [Stieleria maiorica]|uniref:Uncharacterized protein n=1 Tax=Stieleria maiorica TaxID=2795974 RepID=A0A5B9MLI4_9BACT|nr:hypothetical protein Mal15_44460 [Stieleria maiorica]
MRPTLMGRLGWRGNRAPTAYSLRNLRERVGAPYANGRLNGAFGTANRLAR